MFGTGIKTILASGLVAATIFGASASIANAGSGSVQLTFDGRQGLKIQSAGFRHGSGHDRRYDRRRGGSHGYKHGRGHGYRHGGYGGNRYGCSPRRAVNKAWNMGLKHPHVKRVGRHHIVVGGGYHGSRARVTFSKFGHCKVVNFDRNYW